VNSYSALYTRCQQTTTIPRVFVKAFWQVSHSSVPDNAEWLTDEPVPPLPSAPASAPAEAEAAVAPAVAVAAVAAVAAAAAAAAEAAAKAAAEAVAAPAAAAVAEAAAAAVAASAATEVTNANLTTNSTPKISRRQRRHEPVQNSPRIHLLEGEGKCFIALHC
jgi:hypothetical protein